MTQKKLRTLALLLWLALGVVRSVCADWPAYRGPGGQGISQEEKVPTEWNDMKNLKWKLKLPGAGFSSPIAVGDFVFVTCYSTAGGVDNLQHHLLCVDQKNGNVAWKKSVPAVKPVQRIPQFGAAHGYSSHTPVSDGTRIYAFFGKTGVFAFDLKGKELWKASVGKDNQSMFGSAASPVLYKNSLIVTASAESGTLRGLDKMTGKELWKHMPGPDVSLSRCYATPVIAKNVNGMDELFLSVDYEIWGLDPTNGKLRWYADSRTDTNSCPSPVVKDGVVYVIGGRGGGRVAVKSGGKDQVTSSHTVWSSSGGSYVPSPVLYKGHLYWINDRGIATCVDIKTGKEAGKKRIRGEFYASLVLVKDKLIAISRFGGTYVFKATPEWEQIAHNQFADDSDFSGSPAISNGQIILRSNRYLYCVGE